jgi:hypothetical protein
MLKDVAIERKRWQINFSNQWKALFSKNKFNWYDFTIINISGEYTTYANSFEVNLGILGFNIYIVYRRDFEFIDELDARAQIIDMFGKLHPDMEVKDPFGLLDELEEKDEK